MPAVKSLLVAAASAAVFAFVVAAPAPLHAVTAPDCDAPRSASCASECNRKASDCLDGCEEKFKDDDKARVSCKFECTQKRQQCEKDCA